MKWFPLLLLVCSLASDRPVMHSDGKLVLRIWGTSWCEPCRRLLRDWEQSPAASDAISAKYTVCWINAEKHAVQAKLRGVREYPTFEIEGQALLVGYRGLDDLMLRLGVRREPAPNVPAAVPPPPGEQELSTPLWMAEARSEAADRHATVIERLSGIEQRLHDQSGEIHRHGADLSSLTDVRQAVTAIRADVRSVDQRVAENGPLTKVVRDFHAGLPGMVVSAVKPLLAEGASSSGWLNIAAMAAAGSGVGLPVAGGLLVGASILRSVRNRRGRSKEPPRTQPRAPPVVTLDSPPAPQAIIPETRFAAYERDTFAEAFAWASAEMVRKYPGSVGDVETMQSYIDQFLAARGLKKK